MKKSEKKFLEALENAVVVDADMTISETSEVTIPRDEYDELIAESTILGIVERTVEKSKRSYIDVDILRLLLDIEVDEKEAE